MNFAALPPEVNSALMYSGAGSGPIRAAATAWKAMAAELETAATSFRSIITGLTDQTWQGPAATAMATAAAPYAAWMAATATQAGHAGTQANAAAAAYETAFAMTVPPPVIAANRTQLATLIATNILGQNTAAIAANEAHYAQMWAQDATAMYGYAGNAAAATQLPTFTAPHTTPTPATASHALNTATQLAGTAAGTSGSYEGAGAPGLLLDVLVAVLEVDSIAPFEGGGAGLEFGGLAIEAASLAPFAGLGIPGDFGAATGLGLIGQIAPAGGLPGLAPPVGASLPGAALTSTGRVGATWASMGKAVPLGSLSVPQAWAAAAPSALREVALVAAQSGTASASAAAAAQTPFAEMALAGMAGRAMAGTAGSGHRAPLPARAGPTTRRESPDGPEEPEAEVTGVEILAELRGLAELRDCGVLTDEEFHNQRERVIECFVEK
ncbi:PPE domain-containing protein [Mycobacterium sp. pW045]|uniref:PPE family protein, SVP subgroup n=1 Tax=Mycobacterium sp. pW045 TaxID=3238984 RepID=UPI00351ADC52